MVGTHRDKGQLGQMGRVLGLFDATRPGACVGTGSPGTPVTGLGGGWLVPAHTTLGAALLFRERKFTQFHVNR